MLRGIFLPELRGFGKAVVAYEMPEPGKFPSLDSCQKRLLWTQMEAPHPVVGLAVKVAGCRVRNTYDGPKQLVS